MEITIVIRHGLIEHVNATVPATYKVIDKDTDTVDTYDVESVQPTDEFLKDHGLDRFSEQNDHTLEGNLEK